MPGPAPLDDRPLEQPAVRRLPLDHPDRARILAAHSAALAAGAPMYVDPQTALHVLTAGYLAERGFCCGNGCRHCPYVRDGDDAVIDDALTDDPSPGDPAS